MVVRRESKRDPREMSDRLLVPLVFNSFHSSVFVAILRNSHPLQQHTSPSFFFIDQSNHRSVTKEDKAEDMSGKEGVRISCSGQAQAKSVRDYHHRLSDPSCSCKLGRIV